jgi:hypothetical protein
MIARFLSGGATWARVCFQAEACLVLGPTVDTRHLVASKQRPSRLPTKAGAVLF